MTATQELIPPWPVVQARLAENLAERRLLRRLYRLSRDAASEQQVRREKYPAGMSTTRNAG